MYCTLNHATVKYLIVCRLVCGRNGFVLLGLMNDPIFDILLEILYLVFCGLVFIGNVKTLAKPSDRSPRESPAFIFFSWQQGVSVVSTKTVRCSFIAYNKHAGKQSAPNNEFRVLRVSGARFGFTPASLDLYHGQAECEWTQLSHSFCDSIFMRNLPPPSSLFRM